MYCFSCDYSIYGMLAAVYPDSSVDFSLIYKKFQVPISKINCGEKCAPFNERAIPFCCDLRHTVPTAYRNEWKYLRENTDLWHAIDQNELEFYSELLEKLPDDQVLIGCKGHAFCERDYRAISCRSFPFFPYLNANNEIIGMVYFWEYENRCWVISNLDVVNPEFVEAFVKTYEVLLKNFPMELKSFRYQIELMYRHHSKLRQSIILIHRNGDFYNVYPGSGQMRKISKTDLPKFDPYKIAAELPFPDEK